MAGLKDLMDKARHFVRRNPDRARRGLGRAAGFADEKTGGRHSEKIDEGRRKADEYLQGDRKRTRRGPSQR